MVEHFIPLNNEAMIENNVSNARYILGLVLALRFASEVKYKFSL